MIAIRRWAPILLLIGAGLALIVLASSLPPALVVGLAVAALWLGRAWEVA